MAEEKQTKSVTKMSFEDSLSQLEGIVENLEQGNVPLDKSIEFYERGEKLRDHCQTLLRAAEDKVEKIRVGADGSAQGTEPLDS
ncbi:MAG: exodeoxyribonuclease VII small subunit [Rhizobiaceae bacterium]